jgi:hypothetical protein
VERNKVSGNWDCRLTVVCSKRAVKAFRESDWTERLGARHGELLECSPGRFACQFEADTPVMGCLSALSRRWPKHVFLLSYEAEAMRLMGLAKAKAGLVQCHEITY